VSNELKFNAEKYLVISHISFLLIAVYLYHAEWLDHIRYSSVFLELFIVPIITIPLVALNLMAFEYLNKLENKEK